MVSSTSGAGQLGVVDQNSALGPARRIAQNVRLLVGLAAIYGPIALVVELHRHTAGKVFLLLGMWAMEGLAWLWVDSRRSSARGDYGG